MRSKKLQPAYRRAMEIITEMPSARPAHVLKTLSEEGFDVEGNTVGSWVRKAKKMSGPQVVNLDTPGFPKEDERSGKVEKSQTVGQLEKEVADLVERIRKIAPKKLFQSAVETPEAVTEREEAEPKENLFEELDMEIKRAARESVAKAVETRRMAHDMEMKEMELKLSLVQLKMLMVESDKEFLRVLGASR